ncbi:MAG TPA: PDZ domain-containing protein, partial [Pirellulaceae bacterium]
MRIRVVLMAAVVLGSAAGFLVSQFATDSLVSPITSPADLLPLGSGFFFRHDAVLANHVGKNHDRVKEPFRDVVAAANGSTVRIRRRGEQIALGCVVDPEGWILTKLSELQGPLRCALPGGREFDATLVAKAPDLDLALLHIDATGLTALPFSDDPTPPGSWVAMPGGQGEVPLAVGIVGTAAYEVPPERALLGVMLSESPQGPRVDHVVETSMAERIGLKPGDYIVQVNQRTFRASQELIQFLATLRPGDRVALQFIRDGKPKTLSTRLGRISELVSEESAMEAEL